MVVVKLDFHEENKNILHKKNDIPNKIKNIFDTSIKHLKNGKKNFETPCLKKYAKTCHLKRKYRMENFCKHFP